MITENLKYKKEIPECPTPFSKKVSTCKTIEFGRKFYVQSRSCTRNLQMFTESWIH